MKTDAIRIACFGETLWDLFPGYHRIGGAPLNVALRLHSLGTQVHMISRVGKDDFGRGILKHLQDKGVSAEFIQLDEKLPTGLVHVELNEQGSASYRIDKPAAWDAILLDPSTLDTVKNADALLFGSLASRSSTSRNTLLKLIEAAKFSVFDLNLRPPHYEIDSVINLMTKANMIKMNEEELEELCESIGISERSISDRLKALNSTFDGANSICITKGGDGAIWYLEGSLFSNPGYQVKVKDTVGAGDSFLASLIHSIFQRQSPQESLDRACAIGSLVASKEGATPTLTDTEISAMLKAR